MFARGCERGFFFLSFSTQKLTDSQNGSSRDLQVPILPLLFYFVVVFGGYVTRILFVCTYAFAGCRQDRRKRQRREGQRKEVVDYKEAVLDVIVTAKDRYGSCMAYQGSRTAAGS